MNKTEKEENKQHSPSPAFTQDQKFTDFQELFTLLKKKYNVSTPELAKALETKDVLLPVTIFHAEISGLETITKFLRENLHLSYKESAVLLHRSEKTIWQSYAAAKKKLPEPFVLTDTIYFIPISVIASRKLSTLESIVAFLKETYQLSYHEIAVLLHRNDRTVWTVYQRALKKKEDHANR